jgi:hypothetical protein
MDRLIGQTPYGKWTPSGAIFSEDRKYRYVLWRIWNRDKPAVIFIGFNPSKASEHQDDPTVIKVANYAKAWGYGSIYCGNLFAVIGQNIAITNPSVAIGSENDSYLLHLKLLHLKRCPGIILVGWGNFGQHSDRPKAVLELLGDPVYCLDTTKYGCPVHPLYQDSSLKPREYRAP